MSNNKGTSTCVVTGRQDARNCPHQILTSPMKLGTKSSRTPQHRISTLTHLGPLLRRKFPVSSTTMRCFPAGYGHRAVLNLRCRGNKSIAVQCRTMSTFVSGCSILSSTMPRVGGPWSTCGMSFLGKKLYTVQILEFAIVRSMVAVEDCFSAVHWLDRLSTVFGPRCPSLLVLVVSLLLT